MLEAEPEHATAFAAPAAPSRHTGHNASGSCSSLTSYESPIQQPQQPQQPQQHLSIDAAMRQFLETLLPPDDSPMWG